MSTLLGMIAAAAAAFGLDGRIPLSRTVYERIELGMTEAEVTEVIGAKGLDYWEPMDRVAVSGGTVGSIMMQADLKAGRSYGRTWYGRASTIDVFFYPEIGAKGKSYSYKARETPLQRQIEKWQASLAANGREVPEE